MTRLRLAIASIMLLTASTLIGLAISSKEALLESGSELLLEIGPRDPRSLMQGDYMVLNYRVPGVPTTADLADIPYKGFAVLALDENRAARFVRFDDGTPLSPNEVKIVYRRTNGWMDPLKFAPGSFFFEEGSAEKLQGARYVILRVGDDGSVLITGLADENFKKIS